MEKFQINKEANSGRRVFSKSTSHWKPFISDTMHDSLRARTLDSHPQCFSVTETFIGKKK